MDIDVGGKLAEHLDQLLHSVAVQVQVNFKSRALEALMADQLIDISELAARSGLAASALRFYETAGLIESVRSPGNRRRFPRSTLRRVAFIRAAQSVGLTLDSIRNALAGLPSGRTPTQADWESLSGQWAALLDEKIAALNRLRNSLAACIGCGCLSLERCALYNPKDAAGAAGFGARYLLGDDPRRFMRRAGRP